MRLEFIQPLLNSSRSTTGPIFDHIMAGTVYSDQDTVSVFLFLSSSPFLSLPYLYLCPYVVHITASVRIISYHCICSYYIISVHLFVLYHISASFRITSYHCISSYYIMSLHLFVSLHITASARIISYPCTVLNVSYHTLALFLIFRIILSPWSF